MKSTGFAWRVPSDPQNNQHVVTALHAVTGCLSNPSVYSEETRMGSEAIVERALLVADLALLRLTNDIRLATVPNIDSMPAEASPYFIYGYPQFAELMEGTLNVTFKVGRGATTLTRLGAAFRDDSLEALFRAQAYPTRETEIIRLGNPIKSGHSGSPVFDGQGRVVAVVDGALLGGAIGANWAVPTYRYLEQLPYSTDQIPGSASPQARQILKSSVTEDQTRRVSIEIEDSTSTGIASQATELTLLRRITFADLREHASKSEDDLNIYNNSRYSLELFVEDPATINDLSFDIYADARTGATLGVPSTFSLAWDPGGRSVQAFNDTNRVSFIASIARHSSFESAITLGSFAFRSRFLNLASWPDNKSPRTFALNRSPEFRWAQNSEFYAGTTLLGSTLQLVLSIAVSETDLLGTALLTRGEFNADLSNSEKVDYFMMEAAALLLTDFELY